MSVLVVAEQRQGALVGSLGEAVAAAAALGGPVRVAVVGAGAEALAAQVALDGVAEVLAVRTASEEFELDAQLAALAALTDELSPDAVLAVSSATALGWAPRLAVRRGSGFAADVVALGRGAGDRLAAGRGMHGGKVRADVELPAGSVLLLRPASFGAAPAGAAAPVRAVAAPAVAARTAHAGFRERPAGGVDIAQSPFLLAIGRGIGDAEAVEQFESLAGALGATLAASRPLVDAGWVDGARQVGQSGRTVAPQVYLALGISGAVQHLAGIRGAGTVIAVNTDPAAAIFGVADYGVVMDLFDLAEALETAAGA